MIYLLFVASILLFSSGVAGFLAAPYVPTRKKDIGRFLDLAQIKNRNIVYDLGCGDGKILVAAKKEGAIAIGYELSLANFLFCRLRGLRVKFKNFFNGDFREADIVYMFLSQKAHNKMGKILQNQMKTGGKIICYVWAIEGLHPEKIDKLKSSPNIYLYRI